MIKPAIKNFLSDLGLLHRVDQIRMQSQRFCNYQRNRQFKKKNPDFCLPNDKILYETFRLDYQKYYESGRSTAHWLIDQYRKQAHKTPQFILDWGCGPARVVRHFPFLLPGHTRIAGADFNPDTIKWCTEKIKNIDFVLNALDPPLSSPSHSYDFIYAISVFTHLSESRHYTWMAELARLLKKDGILLITTQGHIFTKILSAPEKELFNKDRIIVRDHEQEGRRTFSTFHPSGYIRKLLSPWYEVLDHQPGIMVSTQPQQDIWIVRKK